MGGHQSTQSVNEISQSICNVTNTSSLSCLTLTQGSNVVVVGGDGNDIGNIVQNMSLTVSSDCGANTDYQSGIATQIQNTVAQNLKDQEVAMTQFLDSSKDNQSTNIQSTVATNIANSTVVSCINDLNMSQVTDISGNFNEVKSIVQDATITEISKCMMGNQSVSSSTTGITNAINQSSTYVSKNPLAFISDAIKAIADDVMLFIAAIFIMVVCFVVLYKILHRKSSREYTDDDTQAVADGDTQDDSAQ